MFYVLCPTCGDRVEIPSDAVGPERTDRLECLTAFDYPDEHVQVDLAEREIE